MRSKFSIFKLEKRTENDRTFALKMHRLYATKKRADITSDPLSFFNLYVTQNGISSSNPSIGASGCGAVCCAVGREDWKLLFERDW